MVLGPGEIVIAKVKFNGDGPSLAMQKGNKEGATVLSDSSHIEDSTNTKGKLMSPFASWVLAFTLIATATMPVLNANGEGDVSRTENSTPPHSFEPVTVRVQVL